MQHFEGSYKMTQDVEVMNWLLSSKDEKINNAFTELTEMVWAGGHCIDNSVTEIFLKHNLTIGEAQELESILRFVEFVHDQIGDYNIGKRSHESRIIYDNKESC